MTAGGDPHVRSYFPDSARWIVRSFWNIDYQKVETIQPDVLVLWSQRIGTIRRRGRCKTRFDPAAFQSMYDFYTDVKANQSRIPHAVSRRRGGAACQRGGVRRVLPLAEVSGSRARAAWRQLSAD